jgi:hypothetical protein
MTAAGTYGFALGTATVILGSLAPQPGGSVALWTVLAFDLLTAAAVTWRRTGMPFATASMVSGAAQLGLMAWLAFHGHRLLDMSADRLVAFGLWIAVGVALLYLESLVNKEKWQIWKDHTERVSFWGMLLMRHIPQLRNGPLPHPK